MEKKKKVSGIQKAWRQLSIQNQIFLSMFLITLLGVGVLMNIVYAKKFQPRNGHEPEKYCGCRTKLSQ